GVSVSVNGTPAPLYAVANVAGREQVNFQAPFEIAGRQTVSMTVTRAGQTSAAVDVGVLAQKPAVYTSAGTLGVVVHNPDFSLVTAARPLVAGELAFLYAAGLGDETN